MQQCPSAYASFADTRNIVPEHEVPKSKFSAAQIGAIKDMPEYDPDAEILSLALTIPSWVSSINRVLSSAKFSEISDSVRRKLTTALEELATVGSIIYSAIREKD